MRSRTSLAPARCLALCRRPVVLLRTAHAGVGAHAVLSRARGARLAGLATELRAARAELLAAAAEPAQGARAAPRRRRLRLRRRSRRCGRLVRPLCSTAATNMSCRSACREGWRLVRAQKRARQSAAASTAGAAPDGPQRHAARRSGVAAAHAAGADAGRPAWGLLAREGWNDGSGRWNK